MADNIDTYTFDFETEAERFRRETLATDKILFIEVDVTRDGIRFPTVVGPDALKETQQLNFIRSHISAEFRNNPARSSYAQPVHNSQTKEHSYSYLALRKDYHAYLLFGRENKDLARLGALYHEAGHALLRHTVEGIDSDHPFKECVADAFAALCLLQRFGKEAIPAVSLRSWSRAFDALNRGLTEHMTTPVLEKIIADAEEKDFPRLSVDDMLKLALDYAQEWTPTPEMLTQLRSHIEVQDDHILNTAFDAATACLDAADEFSFYIGAKFYEPFLNPEGIIYGDQGIELEESHRAQCAARIEGRAGTLRLGDIFNGATALKKKGPPLAAAIPTKLPAQQKHFVLSFSHS